jgi:hypothetical protein
MRIDWDGYFDGTMPASERARIDQDPALRAERDGFAAFREALRDAGQAEDVPYDRLHQSLDRIVAAPKRRSPTWALRMAPLVAVLAAFALYMNWPKPPVLGGDRFALARGPVLGETLHPDAKSAAEWLSESAGVRVPVVSIAEPNTLIQASYGKDWASLTFVVRTKNVSLQMAFADKFKEPPTVALGSSKVYQGDKGLGWRSHGVSFYVTGCEDELLLQCATRLKNAVESATWVGNAKRRGARPLAE